MGSYVAPLNVAAPLKEAHFQAMETDGRLTGDIDAWTKAHVQYVRDLKAKGKIIAAGPMVSFRWAVILLRADFLEEARTLVENDPAVRHDLFTDLKVEAWYHMV